MGCAIDWRCLRTPSRPEGQAETRDNDLRVRGVQGLLLTVLMRLVCEVDKKVKKCGLAIDIEMLRDCPVVPLVGIAVCGLRNRLCWRNLLQLLFRSRESESFILWLKAKKAEQAREYHEKFGVIFCR